MDKELLKAIESVRDNMPNVAKNAQGYNYKYTDLPHLWESIEKVVTDAGFSIVTNCDGEFVDTTAIHTSGSLSSKLPLSFAKDNTPQELGSAITYFRRYNLLMLFNVMVEDDDAAKSQKAQSKAVANGDIPFA